MVARMGAGSTLASQLPVDKALCELARARGGEVTVDSIPDLDTGMLYPSVYRKILSIGTLTLYYWSAEFHMGDVKDFTSVRLTCPNSSFSDSRASFGASATTKDGVRKRRRRGAAKTVTRAVHSRVAGVNVRLEGPVITLTVPDTLIDLDTLLCLHDECISIAESLGATPVHEESDPSASSVQSTEYIEMNTVPTKQTAVCQVCGTDVRVLEAHVCPACETPHHNDCWALNKGCSTYGCSHRS